MQNQNKIQMTAWDWLQGVSRRYYHRQNIFLEGNGKEWVYRVEEGAVCLYRTQKDGKRIILDFRFRNEIVGLEAGTRHNLSAQALGTTRLTCLAHKALLELATTDGKFAL